MRRPSLLLAAVLAAVLALTATPATGDTAVRNDPAGDVVRYSGDVDVTAPAPARAQADLLRTRVTHGPEYVRVTARFRALSRTGEALSLVMRIKSPRGDVEAGVGANPRNWRGSAALYPWVDPDCCGVPVTRVHRASYSVPTIECAGLAWRIDYANDEIRLAVPRDCLENPRFVRVTVSAGSSAARPGGLVHYEDRAGGTPGGAPAFSRALFRG